MVDRAVSPPLSVRLEEIRFLTFGRALPATLFAVLGFRVFNNLLAQVAKLPPHASAFDVIAGPFPTALYFLFCSIPVGIYLVRPRPQARFAERLLAETFPEYREYSRRTWRLVPLVW